MQEDAKPTSGFRFVAIVLAWPAALVPPTRPRCLSKLQVVRASNIDPTPMDVLPDTCSVSHEIERHV